MTVTLLISTHCIWWGHHVTGHVTLQGLCHAVRKEAWKFLLGYFPWESTLEERKVLQRSKTYNWCILNIYYTLLALHNVSSKRNISDEQDVTLTYEVLIGWADWCCVCVCGCSDEYFRMKLQWKSVSEEQERRNSRLRDYRSLIGETC